MENRDKDGKDLDFLYNYKDDPNNNIKGNKYKIMKLNIYLLLV